MSEQKAIITGYQYNPNSGKYIGKYEFPNNLDKEEIHLPPYTTLIKPIKNKEGFDIFWNGGGWFYQKNEQVLTLPPKPDNYALLTNGYISYMKSVGQWTTQDQQKYELDLDATQTPING